MAPYFDRVLVTGGSGFLGQHLVRRLVANGCQVRALMRPRPAGALAAQRALEAAGAQVVWGDLSDHTALEKVLQQVEAVFHLAGRLYTAHTPASVYEQIHVQGTHNLLAACRHAALKAFVQCSSTGVLGPTGRALPGEDAPFNPSNIYEKTKAAGERLALEMGQQFGLPVSVARPAFVYGPGDLHLLGWFQAIQRGYYLVVGKGDNLIHPIYVEDVVAGLLLCAQTPAASGQVYNLVGERVLSMRQMAAEIAKALSRPVRHNSLPAAFARGLATLLEALPGIPPERLPLTRSRVSYMTESRIYSGARARDELGFAPQVDLESGLQATVDWYREQGLL